MIVGGAVFRRLESTRSVGNPQVSSQDMSTRTYDMFRQMATSQIPKQKGLNED